MGATQPLIFLLLIAACSGKIMRNNALLSKMMSDYKDKTHPSSPLTQQDPEKPTKVLSLMQNVLCRNFPTIPCNLIMHDEKLKELIEESIQEIKYKRAEFSTTKKQEELYQDQSFPLINSEDLSNFLQVRNTGYFDAKEANSQKNHGKRSKKPSTKKVWRKSSPKHSHHDFETQTVYGKKKIRKFYPHKIKYKDKREQHHTKRTEYVAGDGQSATAIPETQDREVHEASYRGDTGEAPVWRIDYTKHGEPRFNLLGREEQGDSMKTGSNLIVDKPLGTQRKDVLHSDVYIKSYQRKNVEEFNSEGF